MAKSYLQATPVGSTIETAKQLYRGNKMYNTDDWNIFAARGELPVYMQVLSDFDKNVDYNKFSQGFQYGLDKLTTDQKFTAMTNELYGDRENVIKKKRTVTDEATGEQREEEYETTEYDYVKNMLNEQISYNTALALSRQKEQIQRQNAELIDVNLKAFAEGTVEALVGLAGDVYNIGEGIIKATSVLSSFDKVKDYSSTGNFEEALDNAFRSAFKDDDWDDETIQWLRDSVFKYEEGDYAYGTARYLYSMGDSLGRMIPSFVLNGIGQIGGVQGTVVSKGLAGAAQVSYYGGMLSGNIKDLYRDPNLCTRPTIEIVANASLKTAFEIGVERILGKAFGATTLDSMAFGYGAKAFSKIGAKNAIVRIAKDALQEGMEEYFQDFSSYTIDRIFSIWKEDYKGCSEWTVQSASDAFLLGAVMSFAGSTFRVMADAIIKGRVDTGEFVTDKDGNINYNKTRKLGAFESYSYRVTMESMLSDVNEIISNEKLTSEQRAELTAGLYTTIRTITDVFGEFGEQRYNDAIKILEKLESTPITQPETREQFARNFVDTLVDLGKQRSASQLLEKAISDKLDKAGISGPLTAYDKSTDVESTTDNEADVKAIQEFLDSDDVDTLLISEQGQENVYDRETKTLVMPKQNLVFTVDTNLRSVVELDLAKDIAAVPSIAAQLSEIHDIYKMVVDEKGTMEQTLLSLLYSRNFQELVLYNGDKTLVDTIAALRDMYKAEKYDGKMTDILKEQLAIISRNISEVLYEYYLDQPGITKSYIEQSPILSKDQKQQLRAQCWQKDIYHKVVERNEAMTSEDIKVIEIRINRAPWDQQTKDKYNNMIRSDNVSEQKVALQAVNNIYKKQFEGKYNGVIYPRQDGKVTTNAFIVFLKDNHLTLETLTSIPTDEKLVADIKSALKIDTLSRGAIITYWRQKFQQQYGMTFAVDKSGNVSVKEADRNLALDIGRTNLKAMEQFSNQRESVNNALITKSNDIRAPIFAEGLSKAEKAKYTIDDVIKDPRLLSDKIRKEVAAKGFVRPDTIFVYLRDYFLKRSNGTETVVMDENGNYYMARLESDEKSLGKYSEQNFNEIDLSKDSVVKADKFLSPRYRTLLGQDVPNVAFVQMYNKGEGNTKIIDRTTYGYYDIAENTIVINTNAANFNYANFKFTFLHEMRHMLQNYNGLAQGFDNNWLITLKQNDNTAANKIVKDIKKHVPNAFSKNYTAEQELQVASDILYKLSGEASAYGYDTMLNFAPIVVKRDSKGIVKSIVTPWGTEYNKNGVVEPSKPRAIRYVKGQGYEVDIERGKGFSESVRNTTNSVVAELKDKIPLTDRTILINIAKKIADQITWDNERISDVNSSVSEAVNRYNELRKTNPDLPTINELRAMVRSRLEIETARTIVGREQFEEFDKRVVEPMLKYDESYTGEEKGSITSEGAYHRQLRSLQNELRKRIENPLEEMDVSDLVNDYYAVFKKLGITKTELKQYIKYFNELRYFGPVALFTHNSTVVDTKRAKEGVEVGEYGSNIKQPLVDMINSDPEYKRKLMYMGWFEVAPTVTFEEFMNMDIPYWRVVTHTQTGKSPFSSISLGALSGFLTDVISSSTKVERKGVLLKLYVGTIKPRDLIGFVPTGEYEGMIDNADLAKAKIVTVTKGGAFGDSIHLVDSDLPYSMPYNNFVGMPAPLKDADQNPIGPDLQFAKSLSNQELYKDRSRYVSNETAKKSNLKYYISKNQVIEMDPRIQDLNIGSTGIENDLDQDFVRLIKQGKLRTKTDLVDYIRDKWSYDKYYSMSKDQRAAAERTFKLINDYYTHNKYFSSLKQFIDFIHIGLDKYYALYTIMKKNLDLDENNIRKLHNVETFLTRPMSLGKLDQLIQMFKSKDIFSGEFEKYVVAYNELADDDSQMKYMLLPVLNQFDGTIESIGHVARTFVKGLKNGWFTRETKISDEAMAQIENTTGSYDTYDVLNVADIVRDAWIQAELNGKVFATYEERAEARRKLFNKYDALVNTMYQADLEAKYNELMDADDAGIELKESQQRETKGVTVRSTYNQARNIANKILRRLGGDKDKLAKFVDDHPDLGIDKDGNYKYSPADTTLSIGSTYTDEQRTAILDLRKEYVNRLLKALSEVEAGKYGTRFEQAEIERLRKRNEKLAEQVEELVNGKKTTGKVQVVVEGEAIFTDNNAEVPDIIQKVLKTGFEKTRKTEVKNLSAEDEVHFRKSYDEFLNQNGDVLKDLTSADVDQILDFYSTVSLAPNPDAAGSYTRFYAIRQFMLMTLYKYGTDNIIPLTDAQKTKIEQMFKLVKSGSGTELSISQLAQKIINPAEYFAKQLMTAYGVDVDDDVISAFSSLLTDDFTYYAEKEGMTVDQYRMKLFDDIYRKLTDSVREQLKGKPQKVVDELIKWQRLAMLSSPGTWVRNIVSNAVIKIGNNASEVIGNLFAGKKKRANLPEGQYDLINTKLDKNNKADKLILDFVEQIRETNVISLISDAITKYDVPSSVQDVGSQQTMAVLIARNVVAKLSMEQAFPEGKTKAQKAVFALGNFMSKMELQGWQGELGKHGPFVDMLIKLVGDGTMSDNKSITKMFYRYLGKMLKEDFVNGRVKLTEGIFEGEVLNVIANAYTLAAWDHMHRTNWLSKLEGTIRKYAGDAGYLIYKQIEPFASAGWNWFMKGLEYTPIGLITAIKDYVRLENYAEKLHERNIMNLGPSDRFATYLAKRRLGSGIIGTIGTIIGGCLAAFGIAGIDNEDGEPKLYVGDVSLDLSNITGMSGLLTGIACADAFITAKSKGQSPVDAVIEGFTASLNSMFMESTFADAFDMLSRKESFGDFLVNKPGDIVSSFIPNLLKTAMSYSTIVKTQYSKGVLGYFERQAVKSLPLIAYALPKRYDVYTGELQYKYNMPWFDNWPLAALGTIMNYGTPIKVKRRTASNMERLAVGLGVTKSQLTGNYKDIGQLTSEQLNDLNLYYGQLNSESLQLFVDNKTKYTVENDNGKRVQLFYNQMTDKQKKSVITRIMNDNAKYAKVYVATKSGWKYYANETDFKALRSLGINNVYLANKIYQGFKAK